MAVLTTKARKALSKGTFAGPDRSYPIPDRTHAANAKARVSQFGSSALKAKVRAAVARKFPDLGKMDGGRAPSRLDKSPRKGGGGC